LVSEEAIADAIRLCLEGEHMLVEGAAGVAVAGLLRAAERLRQLHAVVVLCGANVSIETLREVLSFGS
jgi:threonine dehydratase